jgi:hypothetical protein
MIVIPPARKRPVLIQGLLLATLALTLLAASTRAQNLVPSQSLTGTWSTSTTWADVDGDGDADMLLTGLTGPPDDCEPITQLYMNDGGTLVKQTTNLPGIHAGAAAFADYDGDGDLDLALSGARADQTGLLVLYRNNNGSFVEDLSQSALLSETLRYSSLGWGDYDGDGDPDLLASGLTAAGNARTVLFKNERIDASRVGSPLGGSPTLTVDDPNSERLVNLNQGNLAWGDLDGDGDLDLALTGYGTDGGRLAALYVNEPLGTLTLDTRNSRLPPVSGGDLAWADYDNDGDLDLAISGWSANWEATLQIFTNAAGILREDLTFSSRRIVGSLAWGDFDNDGDLDLAAAGQTNTSDRLAFVLVNGPPGTLTEDASQSLTGARGGDISWADVDDDGFLDLAVSGEVDGEGRETTLYLSQGGTTANTPPEPPDRLGTPFVTSLGVALDWNDGTDAEATSTSLTYTLRIGTTSGGNDVFSGSVAVGPGNVGSSKTLTLSIPLARDTYFWSVRTIDPGFAVSEESQEEIFRVQDLVSSVQNLRPLRESGLEWGDYDNDGDPDLLLSGRDIDGRGRSILYRNDSGILTENTDVVLQGMLNSDPAWGDYDNDGDLDLAIVGEDAAGNPYSHLYRNRLDLGDFALNIVNVQVLDQVRSSDIDWGDFDNDGDLDLALMGQVPGQRVTKVYRNDGGTLVEETAFALTAADNGDLAWGDVDNDGDLDLAVTGQISNTGQTAFTLYRNDPVGTLTKDADVTVIGLVAGAIDWGDYDGDGDLDLAVNGFDIAGNALITRVYDNDGTGLLTDSAQSISGTAGADLAWGDFDNDGDLDLAILGSSAAGPALELYRNQNGVLTLEPIDVMQGVDFGALGWADIDSDGDLDLLSSGRTSEDGITFTLTSRANDNLESRFNPNKAPIAPASLTSSTSGADVALAWQFGQDSGSSPTPQAALTYEVRVGSEPASNDIRSGASAVEFGSVRLTALTLRNLPSGSYFWSARTIDGGILSSDWSEEETFIVDTVSPVIDSVQVRPRVLIQGRRASVVVNFNDEPAGMDNGVSPSVTIQLANQGSPLVLNQLSYSGDLWIGEVDIETDVPSGSIVVRVTGAKDLKGNTMEPFEQPIPALIAPGGGGVVESPDGVVSLRVSPNVLPASLTENPDVRIDPVPVGTEPTDAVASHGAYEISSSPVITLRKAATLTFNVPQGVSPDRLAVYQLSGTAWSRIGGTAEGDQIRVPVTDLTIYGLFEVSSTTGGTGAVSNIDFSNRAFSPSGRRGGGQPLRAGGGQAAPVLLRTTDISFDLSAPANVRIEIYNRSGRLQTLLTAGQQMNAGRNVVTWDGTNGDGEQVRSGLYIVSIEAGGEGEQKTVAVVNR